ncbi:hypothetical protein Tco_1523340 [Tanacetum coccineum]
MERVATTASSLEAEQDSGNINRTQSMATLNESLPQGIGSGSGPRCQDTILGGAEAQIRFEAASKQSNDPPLSRVNIRGSGEDNMKLKELMELYIKLSKRIFENKNKKSELKPEESDGFEEIIDFLNASYVQYALMVNPTIYTTCIKQFWTSAKVKTVNGERQIQSLVDKKKVIIIETSIRSDLKLDDAEGTYCLPTATIFAELERMGTMASTITCLATNKKFNLYKYIFDNMMKNLEDGVKFLMYPRFVQVFLDKQVEGMTRHKEVYVTPSHTKKVFANIKRPGKGFSGRVTPLFPTIMVQASEDMGEDSAAPTDSHSTPIISQPSSSKPQKKKSRRKQRKDNGSAEPVTDEAHVSTPSYDPPQSGEDRMQLTELMILCTSLQKKVLDLEKAKTAQVKEIASLKKRVKQLEKRRKLRTPELKRLRKVGSANRVESSNDVSLGAQEDASKQGRKIADLEADAEVTVVDETQGRNDDDSMFDTDILDDDKVFEEPMVSAADPVTTAGESTKPKAVTTDATTVTPVSTRPKAKGIVFYDQDEQAPTSKPITDPTQPSSKDKEQAKLERMQRERVEQEEASRAAIIEELDNIQAMIDADEQLAARLQAKEQEQFSIEEKIRMLVEMIAERKRFFAAQRAVEQRSKPPTKAQIRNRMCTYLKNIGGYKHNQLKGRSYEEIQKLFDKVYTQVNSFVPMESEGVKGSEARTEESSKRAGDELKSDKSKKQKVDEHVEAEKDDDPEEEEMKKHMEIVQDEVEIAIDAIPLAIKPPMIVKYKMVKKGQKGF